MRIFRKCIFPRLYFTEWVHRNIGGNHIKAETEKQGHEFQQPYAYWLDNVFGIGEKTATLLLGIWGTPKAVYEAGEKELSEYLSPAQTKRLTENRGGWDVEGEYQRLLQKGITFLPLCHPEYPERLRDIPDRPFAVYVRGLVPAGDRPSAAVIGARQCSEYGRYVAEEFAGALAKAGIQVISGMARGIDGISQRATVEAGGDTYGVLGCGVDICYPASHKALYEQILHTGGILSTYPPGTPPRPALFPPRNRIISGLADALLVVEARHKSGTLITVDMALEQGREVFVIPGRITDRLSDGCNRLIRQGAGIVVSPEDFIREITDITGWRGKRTDSAAEAQAKHLGKHESEILELLDMTPMSIEKIRLLMAARPSLREVTLQETIHILLGFVAHGEAAQTAGGYFVRRGGL